MFSDHRPGFGSTARQGMPRAKPWQMPAAGDFCHGISRKFLIFPAFSSMLPLFSGFFGGFREFAARAAPVPWREPRAQGTARHLKAPPGRALRFSVYEQHCCKQGRVAITHYRTGPVPTCGLAGPPFFHLVWEQFCRMDHLFPPLFTAPDHLRFWVDRHPGRHAPLRM